MAEDALYPPAILIDKSSTGRNSKLAVKDF